MSEVNGLPPFPSPLQRSTRPGVVFESPLHGWGADEASPAVEESIKRALASIGASRTATRPVTRRPAS